MITINALDANNRMRAEKPIVVLLTRRRTPASDAAVRFVTDAARDEDVEAVALDVDDVENAALLDELRVQFIPEIFVCAKGVVLERSGASSPSDARSLIAAALKRARR
jgi:hypothetical protein